MSSVIFQPLLHDSLGWKPTNTTYADTFTWRKHRSTSKDKKISMYGQRYQRQLRKQQELEKERLQQANIDLPVATTEEQLSQAAIPIRKSEENRFVSPGSYRCMSSKTAPAALEDIAVYNSENKQRPFSTNKEATCGSRASHRSSAVPAAAEEGCRPTTGSDARRSPKDEKEKEKNNVDPNNDNSRHWLTFPNPKTPQYLIDIKQRLGQLKVPSTLARPTSASNEPVERSRKSSQSVQRSESSVSQRQQHQAADQRHFLDFNLPETPNDLRAARHRIDKYRYNPSLDNFPQRPQTSPAHVTDVLKPIPTPTAVEPKDVILPIVPATLIKDDAWASKEENIIEENKTEENQAEENKTEENVTSSVVIQPIDIDGSPSDYLEAVEIANKAQEEYLKTIKTNPERKPDNCVYRLPSMSIDNKNDSFVAYRQQQRSTTPNTNNSTRSNDFGAWVRNATDKERESAMKILSDVLNQPVMGYDIPTTKQRTVFKQPPAPTPVRTSSATRKLGLVRTHKRITCDACEKQLIKHHLWNLSRSEDLTCPHQSQNVKSSIIQVQAS